MLKTRNTLGIIATFIVATLMHASPTQADCTGCCSGHGGVVCNNGVTECGDGSPLSQTCLDKSCDACTTCNYTISPTGTASYFGSGGNGTIVITTDFGCTWALDNASGWITINPSYLTGSGSESIPYSVDVNTTFDSRSSDIAIATEDGVETITIFQEGKQPKRGDIDTNDRLDLPDAIGCLQVVASLRTSTFSPELNISDAITVLKILSGIPAGPEYLSIASFNIQTYGVSKASNSDVMAILADIISRFDVVAIQEIRDISGDAIEDLEAAVDLLGYDYEYIIGPRVGRTTTYKEQYAFMYRTKTLIAGDTFTFDDTSDLFEREPYIAAFSTTNGRFDFVLINIHTDPDFAGQEIDDLTLAVDAAKVRFPGESDILVLGDYNADCSYFDENGTSLLKTPEFDWIITNDIDTNVALTSCTYDRIVLLSESQTVVTNAGVFDFTSEYLLTYEQSQDVSDHYPVYVKFVY